MVLRQNYSRIGAPTRKTAVVPSSFASGAYLLLFLGWRQRVVASPPLILYCTLNNKKPSTKISITVRGAPHFIPQCSSGKGPCDGGNFKLDIPGWSPSPACIGIILITLFATILDNSLRSSRPECPKATPKPSAPNR